jgi:hypothetical protein
LHVVRLFIVYISVACCAPVYCLYFCCMLCSCLLFIFLLRVVLLFIVYISVACCAPLYCLYFCCVLCACLLFIFLFGLFKPVTKNVTLSVNVKSFRGSPARGLIGEMAES